MATASRLLSISQLSDLINRCRASIYADIKKGNFPAPLKVGPRNSRWREDDIADWINQLPTADLAETTQQK